MTEKIPSLLRSVTSTSALVFVVVLGVIIVSGVWYGFVAKEEAEENTVVYTERGFSPNRLFINKGETVRFINRSNVHFWPASDVHPRHELYPEFDTNESLPPGAEWSFTFEKVGPWHFHDHLQAHNLGVIYVFDDETTAVDDLCIGSSEEQPYCLVNYLYSLVEHQGPIEAMLALERMLIEKRPVQCHKLSHDIGHMAYALYGADFDQHEVLVMCSGGFFHGIMEGFVSDRTDPKEAKVWCDRQTEYYGELYKDFSARCAHGVGHGIGEAMLARFDSDSYRFKELVVEAANDCNIYKGEKPHVVVCVSGVLSVVIDWIISTNQEGLYFHLDSPFAFCAEFETTALIQECIWEFSQRLPIYHDSYAHVFANLAGYLETAGFLDEFGEWSAMAIGQQFGPPYVGDDRDEVVINICRNENKLVETGCLKGAIEGYILSGIWGQEMERVEKLCDHHLFSDEEQVWCMKWAESRMSLMR